MNDIIIYALKNIVFTGVLYGLWRLLSGHRKNLKYGRFYLLSILLLSIPVSLITPASNPVPVTFSAQPVILEINKVSTSINNNRLINIFDIYLIISTIFLLSSTFKFFILFKKIGKCTTKEKHSNYKICYSKNISQAFSFLNTIYLPDNLNNNDKQIIISHELAHLKQKHSIDIIILEFLSVILWFNPLIYLINNDLKLIHELLADNCVLNQYPRDKYLSVLQKNLFSVKNFSFNTFSSKQLKKRMLMITKNYKTSRFSLFAISLLAIVFSASFPALAQNQTTSKVNVVTNFDEPPQFPGGETELRKFIAEHVVYPDEAKKKNIQGTVFVKFVVNEKGYVQNAEIVHSADPILDKEALRVVNELPKFTPAKKDGKNVAAALSFPISFALD